MSWIKAGVNELQLFSRKKVINKELQKINHGITKFQESCSLYSENVVISIKHYVTGKHWSAELRMFKQQKEIFTQFKNKTFYWDTENFQLTAWIISTSSGSGSGLISNVSSSKLIACLASSSCTQTKRQYNKVISCLALPRSKAKITFDVTIAVLPMKGRVEEMNNFTYLVLAAVAF